MLHSTVSPVSETFDPLERGLVAGAESHEFELIGTEYDGASNSNTPRNKADDFQEDEDISERRFWPIRDGIVHGIRWISTLQVTPTNKKKDFTRTHDTLEQ